MVETACTIVLAGGDEVHTETEVRLVRAADTTALTLRNLTPSGQFYTADGNAITTLVADLPTTQAEALLNELRTAIDNAPPGDGCSLAAMHIQVAATGDWSSHARDLRETDRGSDLDVVLTAIEGFVRGAMDHNT